jgi:hypothetical protein
MMFIHKYYDWDLKSSQRGYYFNFLGLVRIIKFNVATIMEKPDYIFIIEVLGKEFIIK